ncbi:MAG: hypothetical protein KF773_11625 [Deltaproteobacteria bacterium]|nr:hypothetical protein [Deltaproteobacteria bacterium]
MTRAPPATSSQELSPDLARYAWWLGDWKLDEVEGGSAPPGATEHWVAAGGEIYGIGLTAGDFFEVMVVDAAGGRPRFRAMPNGAKSVEFQVGAPADGVAGFANPAHDFPKSITYRTAGAGLVAELEGVEGGTPQRQRYVFSRATGAPAPELEAADRAFAAEVAARGVEGWVAAFEPKGRMISNGARVEGHEAIRELMRDVVARGKLAWAPFASRVQGGVGFTVGTATVAGGTPHTYVTIWRRQPDGAWKVRFTTR